MFKKHFTYWKWYILSLKIASVKLLVICILLKTAVRVFEREYLPVYSVNLIIGFTPWFKTFSGLSTFKNKIQSSFVRSWEPFMSLPTPHPYYLSFYASLQSLVLIVSRTPLLLLRLVNSYCFSKPSLAPQVQITYLPCVPLAPTSFLSL